MKNIILVRGIPGSGKSTYAKSLGIKNHIENDMWYEKFLGSYIYNRENHLKAIKWCKEEALRIMKLGEDLIVSNTFIQRWEMDYYCNLAFEYNYNIKCIIMQNRFKNIHNVPEDKIKLMEAKFEY
jgi:predicted kinase